MSTSIIPVPRTPVGIRTATAADLPFLDALQKRYGRALGYFPTKQFEEYIGAGAVLVAEDGAARPVGYVISRDRYLKRDELGVIYQLCVTPGEQRRLVGAALVRAVFERSAYGCRLYCCWCAQDLEANRFWEGLGFVPLAFRAGSSGKRRVHIFWQRRIGSGDEVTPYWYPFQTNAGAIRQDRLVFPIPPGTHWSEVRAVVGGGEGTPRLRSGQAPALGHEGTKGKEAGRGRAGAASRPSVGAPEKKSGGGLGGLRFGPPRPAAPSPSAPAPRPDKPARAAVKHDPKLIAAARELRDRYLERFNAEDFAPTGGKYDVSRAIGGESAAKPLPVRAMRLLPAA